MIRRSVRVSVFPTSVALFLALSSAPLGGASTPEPATFELGVPAGEVLTSDDFGTYSESFHLPAALAAELAIRTSGEGVRLPAFPTAPGTRRHLELRQVDLYAPEAMVTVVAGGGESKIQRSARIHFLGSAIDDPSIRVGLSLDPSSGALRGFVDGPDGKFTLLEPSEEVPARHRLVANTALAQAGRIVEPECGTEEIPLPQSLIDRVVRVQSPHLPRKLLGGPTHSAVIAVDTDSELLDEKFGNNTAAATDWIADLFLEMNVAYERDVSLRLLIGETFLRPGSPPYTGDPWDVTGSGASGAHLNEFGNYWAANMGGVDRVFAMLLSGKSGSGNSASGIAWVDGYCEFQSSGGGYSFTQVFTSNFSSAGIVAHEIGHNAGSPHTHCYSPEVDQCFNAQSGCYTGPVSCPGGGRGTVMSYCNFSPPNGAGCGQNSLDFHPTVSALFDTFVTDHSPGCVDETLATPIFSDGFESGDTTAW